jgi:hypothetical protein
MYHYQPAAALEELQEEAMLPNPVHVRDMMIRARVSPEQAIELNHKFQEYLHSYGELQSLAHDILHQLATVPLKSTQ